MGQPTFWKRKNNTSCFHGSGSSCSGPNKQHLLLFSLTSSRVEAAAPEPRGRFLKLMDTGQGAGKGRVWKGSARDGASQDTVFWTRGPICSSWRWRDELLSLRAMHSPNSPVTP